MTRRSTKFLIDPEAHLILRPDNEPNGDDPWTLSFANGPVHSTEPEHQAVTLAYSDGGGDLELEFFRWMADQLAGALGVDLILPEDGKFIAPNGFKYSMTSAMKERYPSAAEYMTHAASFEVEDAEVITHEAIFSGEGPHDDSPYNIHHKHDELSRDEEE